MGDFDLPCTRRAALISTCVVLTISMQACMRSESGPRVLTADMPLHLEDHLDVARVEGSELPKNIPATVEWRFDRPQPDWRVTPSWNPP